jgi:hypothetical protein
VACGTIMRGTPDKSSDLDLCVLHRASFRQRVQRLYNGVPCEIFVNPPSRVPDYFRKERKARRPLTAHMLATGVPVYDPEGIAAELMMQAKAELASIEPVDQEALTRDRYFAASLFEDAVDLRERDEAAAVLLLGSAVYELVRCRLISEPAWIPRHKEFAEILRRIDPECAVLAERAGNGSVDERFAAADALCRHVTGASGFFEWASSREEPLA